MSEIEKKLDHEENLNGDVTEKQGDDAPETFAHASLRDLIANAGSALDELSEPTEVSSEQTSEVSEDEIIEAIPWSKEANSLDMIESSDEDEKIQQFEELARRVAATVSQRDLFEANGVTETTETTETVEAIEASEATEVTDTNDSLEALSLEESEEESVGASAEEDLVPKEFIEADQLTSVIESLLFSTDKPVSLATIKQIFKGSNIRTKDITRALDLLASEYAAPNRGVTLEEINGGYQLRTKSDNSEFLRRLAKVRPFKLSGPSLEVMSIIAYKQPVTKHEIDEIRGVESGHLIRALMERGLVCFNGKSDLPGKPMSYGTTRKFLETFGLRNLRELPTMSEIEELLPEGIGEVEEKETLSDITESMSQEITSSYSEGEDELLKINEQLQAIDTTSEFFEQEKQRERERKDRERAQDIRERLVLGDHVEEKDKRWLDRYEAKLAAGDSQAAVQDESSAQGMVGEGMVGEALQALSEESAEMAQKAAAELDQDLDAALAEDFDNEDLISNPDWDEDLESEKDA